MSRVVAAGMATLDVQQRVSRLPRSNEKMTADELLVTFGGPAANAAAVADHLGCEVDLVTVLGASVTGRLVADLIAGQTGVRVVDLATGGDRPPVSTILVEPDGARAVLSVNAAIAPGARPTPELATLLDGASAALVDGHHMDLCLAVAAAARAAGVPVLLDGGSWKPRTPQLLALVDFALLSADFHPPDGDPVEACRDHGVRYVAISDGPRPLRVFTGRQNSEIPVPRVEVHDTLGAGDVLHGAALQAIAELGLSDASIVEICSRATRIASGSCTFPGARGWFGTITTDPQ